MRNVQDSGARTHRRLSSLTVRVTLVLTLTLATLATLALPAQADFKPWERLGSSLVREPASVSWGPGRIDVFTRGAANHVYHQYYENGWSAPEDLGGTVTSAPAVTSWAPGRLDLFARGSAGDLVHRYYDNGWSNWESLSPPGTITSSPTATAWAPGRLDVFARGTTGELVHLFYAVQANSWSTWENLGGGLIGAPAVAAWAPGHVDVVVRGAGDAMYHRAYAPSAWGSWSYVGGALNRPPAIVSHWPGMLDVVVTGRDNAIYHQTFFGGWWGWQHLGGAARSGPSVASWQVGRTDIFVRGTDGALWHTWEKQPTGNGPPPPLGSGSGRRIVYCNSCQRAWHVDENGDWYTFPVSGKVGVPAPGEYHVVRRLSPGGSGDLILPYFVGFAYGSTSDIGFHGIPLRRDGSPIQSDDELGQFRSHGCVRENQNDALRTWNFGTLGTTVVVTA